MLSTLSIINSPSVEAFASFSEDWDAAGEVSILSEAVEPGTGAVNRGSVAGRGDGSRSAVGSLKLVAGEQVGITVDGEATGSYVAGAT
jgi:hypothetical protein